MAKVAVVTGAAMGLGKSFSEKLLKNGFKVAILDCNGPQGRKTGVEFQQTFGQDRAQFFEVDVACAASLQDAFASSVSHFGRLDVVANNAGVAALADVRRFVDVNLMAVILGTQYAVEHMKPTGGGVVVNVASMAGIVPMKSEPVYTATKHAVLGYSRSLCGLEASDNVRVTCLCPSFTDTPLVAGLLPSNPSVRAYTQKFGLLQPEAVAEAFWELVQTGKAGQVVGVTTAGVETMKFPFPPM